MNEQKAGACVSGEGADENDVALVELTASMIDQSDALGTQSDAPSAQSDALEAQSDALGVQSDALDTLTAAFVNQTRRAASAAWARMPSAARMARRVRK